MLLVSSPAGLVRTHMDQATAKLVMPLLVEATASFYWEPLPNEQCLFTMGREHVETLNKAVETVHSMSKRRSAKA